MRKKLESEKYYRWYATAIVKDLIDNNRFQTIVDYVLLAWKAFPNLKKREMLNAKTVLYLNKREKNEKNNIVKFRSNKLN
jgi:hypothetical protein